jgi:hypothetical protein
MTEDERIFMKISQIFVVPCSYKRTHSSVTELSRCIYFHVTFEISPEKKKVKLELNKINRRIQTIIETHFAQAEVLVLRVRYVSA